MKLEWNNIYYVLSNKHILNTINTIRDHKSKDTIENQKGKREFIQKTNKSVSTEKLKQKKMEYKRNLQCSSNKKKEYNVKVFNAELTNIILTVTVERSTRSNKKGTTFTKMLEERKCV